MSATGSNIIISEANLGIVDGVSIRGCYFSNATATAISIGDGCDNIFIQNNFCNWGTISGGASWGISLGSGANGMIQNNFIAVNAGSAGAYTVHASRTPVIVGGNLLRGKTKTFNPVPSTANVNGTDAFSA
jgi:hypothetical protein